MSDTTQGVQMDNICRTCLTEGPNMKSVYDTDSSLGETLHLFEMLMACTSVQVATDDGLPAQICLACFENVARSFTFKKLCEDSDSTLRKVLGKGTVPDESPLIELQPFLNFPLYSQESLADIDTDLLDIRMNFDDADTNIVDLLIAGTEFTDFAKDDMNLMRNLDELEAPTIQLACNDDAKAVDLMPCGEEEELKGKALEKGEKGFVCNLCDKRFKQSATLTEHMRAHANAKSFVCAECGKAFSRRASLVYHQKRHTGINGRICPVCGKKSTSLARHMKIHTGVKDHVCPDCDKRFTSSVSLIVHKRTHTGERPFICNVCNKGFVDQSGLVVHVRTHSGEKPYVCDVCGRGCVNSSQLKTHKRTHTGEKPHPCHLCARAFALAGDLRQHLKVHSGERHHICAYCKKGFYQASRLKVHLRIHTGEKPYTCKICNQSFARADTLTKHSKTHEN